MRTPRHGQARAKRAPLPGRRPSRPRRGGLGQRDSTQPAAGEQPSEKHLGVAARAATPRQRPVRGAR